MEGLWSRLLQSLSPSQVCWLCLLVTCGAAGYGLRTFAKNSDVEAIRVDIMQSRLLDLRIRQCSAIKALQGGAFFAGQIRLQADQYLQLTGRPYSPPSCEEL